MASTLLSIVIVIERMSASSFFFFFLAEKHWQNTEKFNKLASSTVKKAHDSTAASAFGQHAASM